jgi:hypothetical protein
MRAGGERGQRLSGEFAPDHPHRLKRPFVCHVQAMRRTFVRTKISDFDKEVKVSRKHYLRFLAALVLAALVF